MNITNLYYSRAWNSVAVVQETHCGFKSMIWFRDGKCHRDGIKPAINYSGALECWWYYRNGKELSKVVK